MVLSRGNKQKRDAHKRHCFVGEKDRFKMFEDKGRGDFL